HITVPGIMPVVIIMLILRVGGLLSVDFYQILILMGGDASLGEVGDVIQTWVYRTGFQQMNMSLATAVGLFQGVIGFVLVWLANKVANRFSESGGLW
ncbi:MAG: sugar ABC transporter permease, partial [Chloroflexi bacterium]|nr:sugar ABC transporter permease [Chloroflexota bacterium]